MTVNKAFMLLVGVLLLALSLLIEFAGIDWLIYVIMFAGFMFLQAAFTGFCPSKMMLKAFGLKDTSQKTQT